MKIWDLKIANFSKEKCDNGKVARGNSTCEFAWILNFMIIFLRFLLRVRYIKHERPHY